MISISKIVSGIYSDFKDTAWLLKRGHSGTKFMAGSLLTTGALVSTVIVGDKVLIDIIPAIAASPARLLGDGFILAAVEIGLCHLTAGLARRIQANPMDNDAQGYLKPEYRSHTGLNQRQMEFNFC